MRNLIFMVIFSLTFLSTFYVSYALSCSVREGSCLSNETCVLSMYNTVNSHAASCGYYPYNVCCDEIYAGIYSECPTGMSEILSLFQVNNTHAAIPGYYPYKLCAGYSTYPLDCHLRYGSCLSNETCVLSMYNTVNSHVAECNYYPYKLCCQELPDLYVNASSIEISEETPLWGTEVNITVTVWNIGDATANNVVVNCYENGTLFDSKNISNIPVGGSASTICKWNVSCNTNISIFVDPENDIKELNESNNEAWESVAITEKLEIQILNPKNGDKIYRGDTVWLNSSVRSSCSVNPPHTVYWYNESTFLGSGDNITWTIPLVDAMLGNKTITAIVNQSSYYPSDDSVNITILNNLPIFSEIYYNITPPEVQSGDGIEIMCDIYDREDCPSSSNCHLDVNISIKDPNGVWSNSTAKQIGNTFYRDFKAPYAPLGNYTVVCTAVDSDNGYNESAPSKFLVWQNGTVSVYLNSSSYWWREGVRVYGHAERRDGTYISNANVEVLLNSVNQCPLAATDSNGNYECEFEAPNAVGNYTLLILVTDPLTGKKIGNTTQLIVSLQYGGNYETAKNIGCYEIPQLIQNPDGSIKRVMVKICIWE